MGIGLTEGIMIAAIAVLFLRPAELRTAAKTLAKWMGEMKRMSREFTRELYREVDVQELRKIVKDVERDILGEGDSSSPSVSDTDEDYNYIGDDTDYMGDDPALAGTDAEVEAGVDDGVDDDGGSDHADNDPPSGREDEVGFEEDGEWHGALPPGADSAADEASSGDGGRSRSEEPGEPGESAPESGEPAPSPAAESAGEPTPQP